MKKLSNSLFRHWLFPPEWVRALLALLLLIAAAGLLFRPYFTLVWLARSLWLLLIPLALLMFHGKADSRKLRWGIAIGGAALLFLLHSFAPADRIAGTMAGVWLAGVGALELARLIHRHDRLVRRLTEGCCGVVLLVCGAMFWLDFGRETQDLLLLYALSFLAAALLLIAQSVTYYMERSSR